MTDIWDEKPLILKCMGTHEVGVNPRFLDWLENVKLQYDLLKTRHEVILELGEERDKKLEAVKKWFHRLDTAIYNMSISLPPEKDRYTQVKAKPLRDTMLMRDRIKDVLEGKA